METLVHAKMKIEIASMLQSEIKLVQAKMKMIEMKLKATSLLQSEMKLVQAGMKLEIPIFTGAISALTIQNVSISRSFKASEVVRRVRRVKVKRTASVLSPTNEQGRAAALVESTIMHATVANVSTSIPAVLSYVPSAAAAAKQRSKTMANPETVNGEVETTEEFHETGEGKISELLNKLEALKSEKLKLTHENKRMKEKMNKLNQEVDHLHSREEEMRQDIDDWDEDTSFLESIATRSADLEIEVTRLQHDLITSMREVGEAKQEVTELKNGLEEKTLVIERLRSEISELIKDKVKAEKRGRELETKIGLLEVRVKEERGKKTRVQDEMEERMTELKKKIQDLEDEVAQTNHKLKRSKQVKRQCQEKVMGLEKKMLEFQDTLDQNTIEAALSGKVKDIGCKDKGLNVPIMAAGMVAAVVVVAAVVDRCLRKHW
ncbi:putative Phy rapidly regulated 1 [Hibiscus syriacus]|uniref:Phy rapidly regulated 1 n=1 Tax=Hibiscus syriacus TaxID=106335 RepID=A0A6A2ZRG5_HIBSY|nr:putative Phy rapidly regulated 1 [Hibiscus syriacus]